jgi:hypothetical protein
LNIEVEKTISTEERSLDVEAKLFYLQWMLAKEAKFTGVFGAFPSLIFAKAAATLLAMILWEGLIWKGCRIGASISFDPHECRASNVLILANFCSLC